MSPEEFHSLPTPRCDASARKSSATPTIYTQWMPVDDGRELERENILMERVLQSVSLSMEGHEEQSEELAPHCPICIALRILRLLAEMRKDSK